MTMRMLIDARHPEETRVAVVKGSRIEEFDFEAAAKRQIKGNVYLAKVTRVEPSLQAAFVEYGGNRHGFLAFSEIHPDYYQIPKEDREALLREEQAIDAEVVDEVQAEEAEGGVTDANGAEDGTEAKPETSGNGADDNGHEERAARLMRERRMALRRRYKIQEVIKRRQVLLVQVVKEERGNKGAALTTYLSLAGRYCVLMPNTSHGGGISRKISSPADRRRLKSIIDELNLPAGMAAIVRTAGLQRTKSEIKRDFDYLTRLWDDIREATLASTAPALIHEDSDLIKRAIRDIYTRDIDEVLVEGDEGYRAAKGFMKLLMPSHAKKVKPYVDPVPLFQRSGVEGQLAQMYQPVVQLKSGGYIVINPTEALVSIDINSGRSTREHNIEETALKTNCEAADEIARQLRLRDMAGLIVIDFIDMDHGGNVRKVERQMKEALKNDRARIQVGRISSFGLMEMSRQRLRTGVLEASTHTCPMCEGAGVVRSVPSAALAAIRGLEEEAVKGRHSVLTLRAAMDVAIYILNRKRAELGDLEGRYGIRIEVTPDAALMPPNFEVESSGAAPARPPVQAAVEPPVIDDDEDEDEELEEGEDEEEEEEEVRARSNGSGARERRDEPRASDGREEREERGGRRRRRRRRGRRGSGDSRPGDQQRRPEVIEAVSGDEEPGPSDADLRAIEAETSVDAEEGEEQPSRRRRRGRRGGRGRPESAPHVTLLTDDATHAPVGAIDADGLPEAEAAPPPSEFSDAGEGGEVGFGLAPAQATPAEPALAPTRRRRTRAAPVEAAEAAEATEEQAPKRSRRRAAPKAEAAAAEDSREPEPATAEAEPRAANDYEPATTEPAQISEKPRKGWWQRTFGG